MLVTHPHACVNDAIFQPLCGLAAASRHTRSCPEFPDQDFLQLDVQRVLLIHDKAVIDFWKRCRHECAVYLLSRVKENMICEWTHSRLWNRTDQRNCGVTTTTGHHLRIVCHTDPAVGQSHEFQTNEAEDRHRAKRMEGLGRRARKRGRR